MNENQRAALIAGSLLLVLAGGAYYLLAPKPAEENAVADAASIPAALPATPPVDATPVEPLPDHYPVPAATTDAAPLPTLGDSDAPFAAALSELAGTQITSLLAPEQLIRRWVTTIDNLPRERVGMNDRAFRRVPDAFLVKNRDGSLTTSPGNEARYVRLVTLLNTAGAERSAKLYLQFYPLFDKAYRELGYPNRHFNDRLVQVIDHLLAAPYMEGPVELVQPKVFYQFADPKLEALSAGQKMLLRMGKVNATQVKGWLKAFRAQITGTAAPQ